MKRFSRFYLETYTHATIGGAPTAGCPPEVAWVPHVDIYEMSGAILVVAELPGLEREQIQVGVAEGQLSISGIRPKMIPEDTERVFQMEIPYGAFARELPLPPWADVKRIEASYDGGCLKIRIPRKVS